jgi:hypothetical protein
MPPTASGHAEPCSISAQVPAGILAYAQDGAGAVQGCGVLLVDPGGFGATGHAAGAAAAHAPTTTTPGYGGSTDRRQPAQVMHCKLAWKVGTGWGIGPGAIVTAVAIHAAWELSTWQRAVPVAPSQQQ